MKARHLVMILIALAFGAAGFFAGRAMSRTRCPVTEADKLLRETDDVQSRILRANQKITGIRLKHPEARR